jgi:hypothetical protein
MNQSISQSLAIAMPNKPWYWRLFLTTHCRHVAISRVFILMSHFLLSAICFEVGQSTALGVWLWIGYERAGRLMGRWLVCSIKVAVMAAQGLRRAVVVNV